MSVKKQKVKTPAVTEAKAQNTVKVTLLRVLQEKDIWAGLAQMRKAPSVAWAMAEYISDVLEKKWTLIDTQRNEYIKQFATTAEGENPGINGKEFPDALQAFSDALNEYLATEIEMPMVKLEIGALVQGLSVDPANAVDDISLLRIRDYFKAPVVEEQQAA